MYLKSTENRPDHHRWCDPETIVVLARRDHLFKHCYKWRNQQTVMWARVKEATKRGKQKWLVGG